jgi:DNA polymerase-3 subunit beta
LIIPSKALTVFDRVFHPPKDGSSWSIEVRVMPNQVLLRSGEVMLSTALVDGTFPKYDDVIPKECTKRAKLPLVEFHGAIKRAALLTTEDSRAVRLNFNDGKLVISSNSPEQGEARLELPIEYDGEPIDIGLTRPL